MLAEVVGELARRIRVVGAARGAAADRDEPEIDPEPAAAAHRRAVERRGRRGVLVQADVVDRVGHAGHVVRLFRGGVVVVREARLAVEAEPAVAVAREEAHLLAGEQRRRVEDVAERERARAAREPEDQRHLDRHGAPLACRVDDRPERQPVAEIDRVAHVARLERWAAVDLASWACFGMSSSSSPAFARPGYRAATAPGVGLGGRPNGRPSRGRHGPHHRRRGFGRAASPQTGAELRSGSRASAGSDQSFPLLPTAAHGALLSSHWDRFGATRGGRALEQAGSARECEPEQRYVAPGGPRRGSPGRQPRCSGSRSSPSARREAATRGGRGAAPRGPHGPSSSARRCVTRQVASAARTKRVPTPVPAMTRGLVARRHRGVTGAAPSRKARNAETMSELDDESERLGGPGVSGVERLDDPGAERLAVRALLVPEAHDEDRRPSSLLRHLHGSCAAPVTRPSPRRHMVEEALHQLRGLEPELVLEQAAAEPVLADRLADVPLGEMDAYDRAMRALAQRLAGDRREPGLERVGVADRPRRGAS